MYIITITVEYTVEHYTVKMALITMVNNVQFIDTKLI